MIDAVEFLRMARETVIGVNEATNREEAWLDGEMVGAVSLEVSAVGRRLWWESFWRSVMENVPPRRD